MFHDLSRNYQARVGTIRHKQARVGYASDKRGSVQELSGNKKIK
jgi:hypothetical protein